MHINIPTAVATMETQSIANRTTGQLKNPKTPPQAVVAIVLPVMMTTMALVLAVIAIIQVAGLVSRNYSEAFPKY